jgi:hypothetical protein
MFNVLNKFCVVRCLVGKILFWYFRQLVQRTKKLYRDLVGDKNVSFCHVFWPSVCPVPTIILKSNTVQLKLSYPMSYFLADKTHQIMIIVSPQKMLIMLLPNQVLVVLDSFFIHDVYRVNSKKKLLARPLQCLKGCLWIYGPYGGRCTCDWIYVKFVNYCIKKVSSDGVYKDTKTLKQDHT